MKIGIIGAGVAGLAAAVRMASRGYQVEVFEANSGEATPIGLARGLNAQWTDGGLLYSPPFR